MACLGKWAEGVRVKHEEWKRVEYFTVLRLFLSPLNIGVVWVG